MKLRSRLMLAGLLTLAVTGCAGSPVIIARNSDCPSLLPDDWDKGVAHTPDPEPAPPKPQGLQAQLDWTLGELKKWVGFGVSESEKVDEANGRYRDGMGIVRRCNARDAAAVKAARPKVLGIF